jgi:hypothetical protein
MGRYNFLNRRTFSFGILCAGCFIATAILLSHVASAQMDKVKASMAALKAQTDKLGPPRIEDTDGVAGKDVPALYSGASKMNNNFDVVDEAVKENGGTATLFVQAATSMYALRRMLRRTSVSARSIRF